MKLKELKEEVCKVAFSEDCLQDKIEPLRKILEAMDELFPGAAAEWGVYWKDEEPLTISRVRKKARESPMVTLTIIVPKTRVDEVLRLPGTIEKCASWRVQTDDAVFAACSGVLFALDKEASTGPR